jgi:predicted secreted protein
MNRNDKAREVEARLHRSLMNQVRVPQLDRRFDAAVWARIEAQEQAQAILAQAAPHKPNSERWLLASNVVGIAVAAVLVLYFGLRMFSGVDLANSLPDFSAAQNHEAAGIISWVVAAASVCVAAMFTPLGRWLRSEFT